jgi:PmbA protein
MGKIDYIQLAADVVAKAKKIGAGEAEAFLISSKDLTIDVRDNQVETMKLAEDRGLGVRVITDSRIGFAFTSDLNAGVVEDIIRQAIANSDKTTADKYNKLPPPGQDYPELDLFDPGIHKATVESKIDLAKTMEQVARATDRRVTITERSTYFDAEYEVTLANSFGFARSYRGAYCGAYTEVVAEQDGDSQTGFDIHYGLKFKDIDPTALGRGAAEKAVRKLGAKSIKTQQAAIILEPYIATQFLSVISPSLSAEAVQKGRSLFAGKVGQQVASPRMTVVDDGARPGGIASAPFDGEGVPTGKTVLIKDGILQGFLHNTYTAAKDGTVSTGNGIRGSFKSTPEVGATNFYIEPGATDPTELIKNVPNGLFITEVMGMHTANPISGDFSLGAAGIWIENGRFIQPVRGVAIAGNMLDFLNHIDEVGSDLRFYGGKGSPTLRIAKMTISGS